MDDVAFTSLVRQIEEGRYVNQELELNLDECAGDKSVLCIRLAAALRRNENITKISFDGHVDESMLQGLVSGGIASAHVDSFNFSAYDLQINGRHLANFVNSCSNLQSLEICNDEINSEDDVQAITAALLNKAQLQTLDIAHLPLNSAASTNLCQIVSESRDLHTLALHGCTIGSDGLDLLCREISAKPNITSLIIPKLNDAGRGYLSAAEMLKRKENLYDVEFEGLRGQELNLMAKAISENKGIGEVKFNHCHFLGTQIQEFAQDLNKLFLQDLVIDPSVPYHLSAADSDMLLKTLAQSQALKNLELSGLTFDDSAINFWYALKKNSSLDSINIRYSRFMQASFNWMAKALIENTSLTDIKFFAETDNPDFGRLAAGIPYYNDNIVKIFIRPTLDTEFNHSQECADVNRSNARQAALAIVNAFDNGFSKDALEFVIPRLSAAMLFLNEQDRERLRLMVQDFVFEANPILAAIQNVDIRGIVSKFAANDDTNFSFVKSGLEINLEKINEEILTNEFRSSRFPDDWNKFKKREIKNALISYFGDDVPAASSGEAKRSRPIPIYEKVQEVTLRGLTSHHEYQEIATAVNKYYRNKGSAYDILPPVPIRADLPSTVSPTSSSSLVSKNLSLGK